MPDDHPTIQAAVDAAAPGALVLVAPGTYHESVTVTTDGIVIRGLSCAETIVDGEFALETGFKIVADGVAIENLTARRFNHNAFIWTGVSGYRGSYLNAVQNGQYGLYAFDSVKGQFDHSYAAGNSDGGVYIGQCDPCDAVVTDIFAEWNGFGYEGTNAGGDLYIVNSTWRNNHVGIAPNSSTGEENYPQHGAAFAGNVVEVNNNAAAPGHRIASILTGIGIVIAGGNENLVSRNLVRGHDIAGIAITPFPERRVLRQYLVGSPKLRGPRQRSARQRRTGERRRRSSRSSRRCRTPTIPPATASPATRSRPRGRPRSSRSCRATRARRPSSWATRRGS